MKIVRYTLLGLVGLVLALVAIAYALPSTYHVARSIEIEAPAAKVYPFVANVRAWKEWSAWNARDPNMEVFYSGPESGKGARWTWTSKSEGRGEMTLTDAAPDRKLDYALYFPDFDTRASGAITFDAIAPTTTRVTWTNDGELGSNPFMRWMGLAMDRLVGNDFATGLENLRTVATR